MAMKSKSAPGTDRVYAIVLIHLILCITMIAAFTPGDEALTLGGVKIAPTLQWWNAAFNAFSIIALILAAVGVLYFIEWHLDLYWAVLAISLAIDLVWFAVFLAYGTSCTSGESTMSCSFNAAKVVVVIVAIALFKVFAVWSVLKAKRAVRIKYNEELLPYLRASLTKNWVAGGAGMVEDGTDAMNGGQALDGNGNVSFAGASGTASAGAVAAGLNSCAASGKAVSFAGKPDGTMCVSRPVTGDYGTLGTPLPARPAASPPPPSSFPHAASGGAIEPARVRASSLSRADGALAYERPRSRSPAGNASYYGAGSVTRLPLSSSAGAAGATSMGAARVVGAPVPLSSTTGAPVLVPRAAISSSIAPIGGASVGTQKVASLPGTPRGSLLAVPRVAVAGMPAPAVAAPPVALATPPTTAQWQSATSLSGAPMASSSPTAAAAAASALFDQIDRDGDGAITRAELARFQAASGSPRVGTLA